MALVEHTAAFDHGFGVLRPSRAMVFKPGSGENIKIQTYIDGAWLTVNTITENSAEEVYTQGLRIRVLPSGSGSVFAIDMSER